MHTYCRTSAPAKKFQICGGMLLALYVDVVGAPAIISAIYSLLFLVCQASAPGPLLSLSGWKDQWQEPVNRRLQPIVLHISLDDRPGSL